MEVIYHRIKARANEQRLFYHLNDEKDDKNQIKP